MANTTNFNWETPDDTDLVKDGAAAIRTLGNSIDTSFVDLKGGTTGQILSKASNTDLDYTWIANDQGDITEVQAGTGISVASGTGPIPVVTNTVATAYDAKADLIVGTGADTFSRLAVGANNTVLTADSSVSPTGLKWAVDPVADVVTTAGDLIYGTAADTVARLGIGTAGQVLKVNSGATAPEWGSVSGGGKVLQVVAAYTSTQVGNSTDTYADTGLSCTITPTLNTSKVLVLITQMCSKEAGNSQSGVEMRLVRGATTVETFAQYGLYTNASEANRATLSYNHLDSPATTSATTYKTQFRNEQNAAEVQVQSNSAVSSMILLEIGA